MQVTITRDGDDLVAAILDDAGSAQLVRISRNNGDVAGRSQVAGDVAIEQISASRGSVVVRRADPSIARVARARVIVRPAGVGSPCEDDE